MHVLILEDDPMMRELLSTIVLSQNPATDVLEAETLDEARSLCNAHDIGLMLCDWTLPGRDTGLDLVRQVRETDRETPIFMVTGRGDRQSVMSSVKLGVNGFIVKPFDPTDVGQRLRAYLLPDGITVQLSDPLPSLLDWLSPVQQRLDTVTLMTGAREALQALSQDSPPSARDLSRRWLNSPALTSRLIRIANSSLYKRSGQGVNTLLDAINAMGVTMALNQVVALSMNDHSRIQAPHLRLWLDHYSQECQAIADEAARLARQLNTNTSLCYTAGLLHRLGEITLLHLIQNYLDNGGQALDVDIDAALATQAPAYGNAVKVQWNMPLDLRERIGATHYLAPNVVRQDVILMAVAAARAKHQAEGDGYTRNLGRLGL